MTLVLQVCVPICIQLFLTFCNLPCTCDRHNKNKKQSTVEKWSNINNCTVNIRFQVPRYRLLKKLRIPTVRVLKEAELPVCWLLGFCVYMGATRVKETRHARSAVFYCRVFSALNHLHLIVVRTYQILYLVLSIFTTIKYTGYSTTFCPFYCFVAGQDIVMEKCSTLISFLVLTRFNFYKC